MIGHDFPTNPIQKNFLKDGLGSNSSKHNKTVEVGYTFRSYSFALPLTFNKYDLVQGEVCLVAASYGSKSRESNTPAFLGAGNFILTNSVFLII